MAQRVKNPPAVQETQETQVHSLGWEDPLEAVSLEENMEVPSTASAEPLLPS